VLLRRENNHKKQERKKEREKERKKEKRERERDRETKSIDLINKLKMSFFATNKSRYCKARGKKGQNKDK
jgi:hypothetical protein